MPGHVRRHICNFSDREIMLLERAVLCYAAVMKIRMGSPSPREADDTVRTAAIISGHRSCKCPVPVEEGALNHQ